MEILLGAVNSKIKDLKDHVHSDIINTHIAESEGRVTKEAADKSFATLEERLDVLDEFTDLLEHYRTADPDEEVTDDEVAGLLSLCIRFHTIGIDDR